MTVGDRLKELWWHYKVATRYRSKWIKGSHEVPMQFVSADHEEERFRWCQENVSGKFCTDAERCTSTTGFIYRYGFSRPEDAFAFKMRWA